MTDGVWAGRAGPHTIAAKFATEMRASAPPFGAGVKAGAGGRLSRPERALSLPVLVLDVLTQVRQGCASDGVGEVGAGP